MTTDRIYYNPEMEDTLIIQILRLEDTHTHTHTHTHTYSFDSVIEAWWT